ncbi:MAG TPA: sigma-70 family RNA polymerase sigma factor, partial [Planctomycetaceae bacterium]|nr:sigma-70 family RNA polymerase sigma factor [Planctomycetaceae bacterium]
MNPLSAELVERYRAGDDEAATILFERYVEQLTRLARTRLSLKLAKRTAPDDIVMSAYRSFFLRTREGRFRFEQSGDLWALLVQIVLHKIARSATRHRAERRSIENETPLDQAIPSISTEPSPDEVVAFNDELESLMTELEPATRRVLELRLQGNSQPEIAHLLGISDRTVRRRLNEIRTEMTGRLSRFGVIVPHEIPDITADKKSEVPRFKPVETEPLDLSERVTVSDLGFSIERFLGGGGFGRVFFARRKRDGNIFALKFLRKQFLASSRAVRA